VSSRSSSAPAFDLLVTFVESPERMLTKAELIEAAWPRLVVEENNLNVQILSLRVLGHAAITTIPGRGYRFTMPVTVEGDLRSQPKLPEARIEQRAADAAPLAAPTLSARRPRSTAVPTTSRLFCRFS
jgi:DNA-binding winged helix-turn-helix (wHTH) protein